MIIGIKNQISFMNAFDDVYFEHLNRSVRGSGALPILAPGRSLLISATLDFQ